MGGADILPPSLYVPYHNITRKFCCRHYNRNGATFNRPCATPCALYWCYFGGANYINFDKRITTLKCPTRTLKKKVTLYGVSLP